MKNFHSFYLNQIKNKLGASFVAWEESKTGGLKLKVKKGKTVDYFKIDGTIDNVTMETYLHLLIEIDNEE